MTRINKFLAVLLCALLIVFCFGFARADDGEKAGKPKDFIKWVDLNFTEDILNKVYQLDIKYNGSGKSDGMKFNFIDALAYLAVKNGNQFSAKDSVTLNKLVAKLESGETIEDELGANKYYKYYRNAFKSVFSEYIGVYQLPSGEVHYGLIAYFPLARGYWYNHYDDFGNSRSYGFKRKHLGHDMMGATGTPIVAIEGGTVTELGWNKYGGWRVGILSFDKTRYYYYAHLRKNHPYANGLKTGDTVNAGQVIGYLGMTGYSDTENQNLKSGSPHLHLGLQLIFDESQIKGNKEIWVDLYAITNFLARNRAKVVNDNETKEFKSIDTRRKLQDTSYLREIKM